MAKTIYVREIPKYGDLMTVKEWLDACERGAFIDYDGMASAVKDGKATKEWYYPSGRDKLPKDATHVVWFNR